MEHEVVVSSAASYSHRVYAEAPIVIVIERRRLRAVIPEPIRREAVAFFGPFWAEFMRGLREVGR